MDIFFWLAVGFGMAATFLVLLFLRERAGRLTAESMTEAFQRLADFHWQSFRAEQTALEAAKQKTEEDDDLMVMASVVIDYLYDENEELGANLEGEQRLNDEAGELMTRAADYIEELEADLDEAEDDVEEAEEDLEEIQGIAEDAVKNSAGYDALIKHVLDLADRVLKEGG